MIVHLFNSSSVSGPERLVLPALASSGNHFVIINLLEDRIERLRASDPLELYARSLNLPYDAIHVRGRADFQAVHELQQLLLQLNPSLVHAHGIKASIYLLQAQRKSKSNYLIVSTHHGARGLPDWKVKLYEFFYRRFFLRFFDRVLCVSSADHELLLHSGISSRHLRLHFNGVDGHLIAPEQRTDEAQHIRRLWFPKERHYQTFFLGVVARLSPEKDHFRLLRILSRLNQLPCDRDWRCLIFGMGELEMQLRQSAQELGLSKRVVWMGYRENVGNELVGLDLLLSFSKAEGLPINLIEAGWAGTPVMSTSVGGVVDLIPNENDGQGVLPKEPVAISALRLQMCMSAKGRMKLDEQARSFQGRVTQEFTQKKWLHRLDAIYSDLGVAP